MHIEWRDEQLGRNVKGMGITPKFGLTPGKVWRGSVAVGYDNQAVFGKLLGLSDAQIEALKQGRVI